MGRRARQRRRRLPRVAFVVYDELSMLAENAAEVGLPFTPPKVERRTVEVGPDLRLSALVWGDSPPELVLIHGGAQNAHTWDTVALALDRPLVAIDLLGHGHSSWRADQAYGPPSHAEAVAIAVQELAPAAAGVVGMSLGGLTTMALAARHPELVRRAVIVDVTPGVGGRKPSSVAAFVDGPEIFASFEEILERTVQFNPGRSEESLRRGILHNATQLDDGTWTWRYDRRRLGDLDEVRVKYLELWADVSAITCPMLLVRGGDSKLVPDEDVEEWRRRQPGSEVVVVDGAGHSVQSDRPLELAGLIEGFVFERPN
jgi:pimeloyl-ACP methyl ester carboxylesterase